MVKYVLEVLFISVCFYFLFYSCKQPVVVEMKDNVGAQVRILKPNKKPVLDTNLYRASDLFLLKTDDSFRLGIESDGEIRPGCGAEGCFGRCNKCE